MNLRIQPCTRVRVWISFDGEAHDIAHDEAMLSFFRLDDILIKKQYQVR